MTLSNKIARRIRQDNMDADNTAATEGEITDASPTGNQMSPLWSKLTARQKQIQMSVLARRSQKAG